MTVTVRAAVPVGEGRRDLRLGFRVESSGWEGVALAGGAGSVLAGGRCCERLPSLMLLSFFFFFNTLQKKSIEYSKEEY